MKLSTIILFAAASWPCCCCNTGVSAVSDSSVVRLSLEATGQESSNRGQQVEEEQQLQRQDHQKVLFDNWLMRYKKLGAGAYGNTKHRDNKDKDYDYDHRFNIFRANMDHIAEHNAAFQQGWTLYKKTFDGPFMDLTDGEFVEQYLMEAQDCSATDGDKGGHTSSGRLRPTVRTYSSSAPSKHPHIDWRTRGILTPVKNQGHCGSCWTFSTTGCLESHICLAAGKDCSEWTGLSEEQLVECAGDFNNFGCNGGLPSQAYEYLKYNGGLMTEHDYPYTAPSNGGKSKCSIASKNGDGRKWTARVSEVFNITSRDEDDLQHAVAEIGPVSIAYQVSPDFRFYEHGIYDSYNVTTNSTMCHDGTHDVNHAVVAVGLGTSVQVHNNTTTETDYYIVRNSWSADWGMEGHFWIKRGSNLCGLADCASFPIVPVSTSKMNPIDKASIVTREQESGDGSQQGSNSYRFRRPMQHLAWRTD